MAASKTAQPDSPIETIEPSAQWRDQKIGVEPNVFVYTQKPLSFFQKMEVFAVLGSALDKAISGPSGLNVEDLMGVRERGADLTERDYADAQVFLKAIARLVQYAPDLLADLYVILLSVPRQERVFVQSMMELPEDEGGLSDEDGLQILETFVDQNWDVMVDFFKERITPLFQKISQKVQGSAPSKP
jgi:hypothetical protein